MKLKISGEHGIGYVKTAYLDIAIDAPTLEIMKGIKKFLTRTAF